MMGSIEPGQDSGLEPREVVEQRVRNFRLGDFGAIYDSYHPDSFFLRQFPDRDAYIRHGWAHLRRDIQILSCKVLRQRQRGDLAEVIFTQVVVAGGERHESVEMARLWREKGRWLYHSAQKVTREELGKSPEEVEFSDFDKIVDKVFF